MYNNLEFNDEYGIAILNNEIDVINDIGELNDILGNCYFNGIHKIMINWKNLNKDFFDLKTGFAGDVLQKIVMYKINTAFVISEDKNHGRFSEMIMEANRGREFNFFFNEDDAVEWLKII